MSYVKLVKVFHQPKGLAEMKKNSTTRTPKKYCLDGISYHCTAKGLQSLCEMSINETNMMLPDKTFVFMILS